MNSKMTLLSADNLVTAQVRLPNSFDMNPQSLAARLAALALYGEDPSRETMVQALTGLQAFLDGGDRAVLVQEKLSFNTVQGARELSFDISSNNQLLGACRALREFSQGYEPDVACAMALLSRPDSVIIDAGANWGPLSIQHVLSTAFRGQIHAFEPQAAAFAMLQHIVSELGLSERVLPQRFALSDEAGEAVLSSEVWSGDVSVTHNGTGERCAMATLDELLPGLSPHFIKIDVNGFEHRVIAGAREMIARAKPHIVFEDRAHNEKQHYATLSANGYSFYCLAWYDPFRDVLSEKPPFAGEEQLLAFRPFEPAERDSLPERINVLACAKPLAQLFAR